MMADITVTDPSHHSHLVEGFMTMKEAGELFDYVIRGSNEIFSIHSLVLASMSPVFKAMLMSNMEEAAKREASFPTIPDDIMRKLIDFAYTGTCTISREDLMPLITAAHFLEMSTLMTLCKEHISTVLQPSNCFLWSRIADRLQLETIRPQIQKMMITSHKEVICSDEFKDVEKSEIVEYLSNLFKKGIHSDTILEAALEWIKHDSSNRSVHTPDLFACVAVEKCTRPFLSKLVQENAELLETQHDMYRLMLIDILTGDSKLHEDLLILGGLSCEDVPNNDCWMFRDDHLVKFAEGPDDQLKPYHSVCQVPQGVMLTGGDGSNMCKLFDVANKTWIDKVNLLTARSRHASSYLNSKLFVIGGMFHNGLSGYQSTDYLDLDMHSWQHGPDLPEDGFLPKVAICNSKLFVLLTKTGILYCLGSASWTKKASLPTSSYGCSMAALDDRMFAAGGDNNINFMYIPNSDTWCLLTGPTLNERQGALVPYKQKLYLVAGCKRDAKMTDVEEYDISSNTWSLATWKLPKPLWLHAAFVVNIPA